MASNLSKKIVDNANKDFYGLFYSNKFVFFNKYIVYFVQKKIRIKNIILSLIRSIYISIFKNNLLNPSQKAEFNIDTKDIDKISTNFKLNHYAYCENFLNKESHDILVSSWPSFLFFQYPNEPIKNYNFGFRVKLVNKYHGPESEFLKYAYNLNKFYKFLRSSEMERFVNTLVNKSDYKCVSMASSTINNKSFLAPHTDSIGDNNEVINFVFFISGSQDPEYSAGTSIYEDNEFKKTIASPKTLNNSFIVYNSTIKFYHGFKKVKKRNYRFAISAQFSSNYPSNFK